MSGIIDFLMKFFIFMLLVCMSYLFNNRFIQCQMVRDQYEDDRYVEKDDVEKKHSHIYIITYTLHQTKNDPERSTDYNSKNDWSELEFYWLDRFLKPLIAKLLEHGAQEKVYYDTKDCKGQLNSIAQKVYFNKIFCKVNCDAKNSDTGKD